jgi:ketosteroid isomerase-like protein
MPADQELVSAVLRAERAWLEAHLKLDSSLLDLLAAPDYEQVTSDGSLVGKGELLASFGTGERWWDAAKSDQHVVRVYGEVAVVTGRWRAKGSNSGHRFDYSARYVAVWVWRGGRWQLASDQSTTIPGATSAL